jgi:hypothetical protein
LVGTTHAVTRLPGALMQGPPRAFACASSVTPSHDASRHTRSRNARLFSADPGGEDNRIESAECGGERAKLAPDAIGEQVDRGSRSRLAARLERAHVARNARHAEQSRLLIQELLDCPRIHLELVQQVQDDT